MPRLRAPGSIARHILAAALVAVFASALASADSIVTILNHDGKAGTSAVGVNGPFTLTASEVTSIDGVTVTGSMSFTTGAWISGTLQSGATWAGGGTFTIKESGSVIFSGSFSGNVQWVFNGCGPTNQCSYTLTGPISGTYMGNPVTGATTQLNFTTNGLYTGGSGGTIIKDTGGTTSIVAPTPEPASLALMGTGLLGVGFAMRRRQNRPLRAKAKARRAASLAQSSDESASADETDIFGILVGGDCGERRVILVEPQMAGSRTSLAERLHPAPAHRRQTPLVGLLNPTA